MSAAGDIQARKAEVKRRLPVGDLVEKHVKLSGSRGSTNRRGKCPFHSGNSPSFSVKNGDKPDGFAHCFGCQWHGDSIRFAMDMFGLSFMDALAECERLAGVVADGEVRQGTGTLQRERNPAPNRERRREFIEPIEMGRAIWQKARPDEAAVRRYFRGRGVPESALSTERLCEFRYLSDCPCVAWDRNASPAGLPIAPAIMALVKVPRMVDGQPQFTPTGLHVTYLSPDGEGTMKRRKPWAKSGDPDPFLPKRRMLGPVAGGAVLLGRYDRHAPLYVGEGNETVLSAIGLAGAPMEAIGIAVLSLDNLQGGLRMWKSRTWPLHQVEPDPDRPAFTIPGHTGPVTGLVDSDMSPLRGMRDRRSGEFLGEAVVECKGGPIVRRAITGAERARICGELFVQSWRAAGIRQVAAVRAPAGMDFNDAAALREGRAA